MYTGLPSYKKKANDSQRVKACKEHDNYLVHFMVVLRVVFIDFFLLCELEVSASRRTRSGETSTQSKASDVRDDLINFHIFPPLLSSQ